jgi:AcrR family transcriptional regulator
VLAKTPATPTSADKPQERREQILDAALELFTKQGYEGTSIDQIRLASGFKSKASLYNHFTSKEEVSTALTARILTKLQQLVMTAEASVADNDALSRFQAVFRAYIHWGLSNRAEFVFRIIRAQELRLLAGADGLYDFQSDPSLQTTSIYARFIDILESLRRESRHHQKYRVREITNAALFHMAIGTICRAAIDLNSFQPQTGKDNPDDASGTVNLSEQVEQILEVCMGIVFTHPPLD